MTHLQIRHFSTTGMDIFLFRRKTCVTLLMSEYPQHIFSSRNILAMIDSFEYPQCFGTKVKKHVIFVIKIVSWNHFTIFLDYYTPHRLCVCVCLCVCVGVGVGVTVFMSVSPLGIGYCFVIIPPTCEVCGYTPDIRSMWGYNVFAFPFVRLFIRLSVSGSMFLR